MTSHNLQSLKTTFKTNSISLIPICSQMADCTKRSLIFAIATAPFLLFVLRFDGCCALRCFPWHKIEEKPADTGDRFILNYYLHWRIFFHFLFFTRLDSRFNYKFEFYLNFPDPLNLDLVGLSHKYILFDIFSSSRIRNQQVLQRRMCARRTCAR